KTADGRWLLEESETAQKLEGGESVPQIMEMIAKNKMLSSWTIGDTLGKFKMTGELTPSFNQVHVLVVVPVKLPTPHEPGDSQLVADGKEHFFLAIRR
ncbi:hypothetical protein PR001_g32168, partial [Phytophthora rubi]